MEAIRKMGPPVTKSQLQTFWWGMNTFHIFLPDLANTIIPLNGLLTKEKTMNDWDDACDEAFLKAKESLIKIVMLIYSNPVLEYKIYADASGEALGGMLAKTDEVQGRNGIYLLVSLPIPSVKWNDVMLPLPKKHLQFSIASRNGTLSLITALYVL